MTVAGIACKPTQHNQTHKEITLCSLIEIAYVLSYSVNSENITSAVDYSLDLPAEEIPRQMYQ